MTSISYLQATSNRFVVVQGRLQALGGQTVLYLTDLKKPIFHFAHPWNWIYLTITIMQYGLTGTTVFLC